MRYRAIEVRDVALDGPHATATGTVECWDANPQRFGPNRIPVARYTGPLVCANHAACDRSGDWQPVGTRGDHPERWQDIMPSIARLADLVKESEMTQARVAELAEMTPGNLSRLLAGHKPNAGIDTVARVLDAIGKRWADLDR